MKRLSRPNQAARGTLLAGAALACALLLWPGNESAAGGPAVRVAASSGILSHSNSRAGEAILEVPAIGPGDHAVGSLVIENSGTVSGEMTVTASNLNQSPGAGGAMLGGRLFLAVHDRTARRRIWFGTFAEMSEVPAGVLLPGQRHVYRFTVMLPGAAADPMAALAGAWLSVDFNWTEAPARIAQTVCGDSTLAATPLPLVGGDGDDNLAGTAGRDVLRGMRGGDCLAGGGSRDEVHGGAGPDRLYGGPGGGVVGGGPGNDDVHGGSGDDRLYAYRGRDRFSAGAGADIVHAHDRRPERVDCGPGNDVAGVDAGDRVSGCERVFGAG